MNARQARQRRALLHPHWFASANPPDRTEDSTDNLSKNSTTNSLPPIPTEPPPPALAAPNADDATSIVSLSSGESHFFAANVSQQEQLRGVEKVEPSPLNKVEPERRTSPELPSPKEVVPLCLFSFSDGRHCRLPRAEHDPRFCPHHTANNVKAKKARKRSRAGQAIELKTPSGNFTTATDLNYALSQVFRSLAQNRIRPRNAAALGYLGQLLLQTLPGVKSEFSNTFGFRAWDESVKALLGMRASDDPTRDRHPVLRRKAPTGCAFAGQQSRTGAKDLSYAPDDSHIQQNQYLRDIHPHPSQNQHLRKL